MRASLIIPVRNERDFIIPCLESLLRFRDKEQDEVLLIDGCSSDDTLQLVARHFESDVKVLHNQNKSFAAAVNIGIRASQGEFVLIIGAHAVYPPNYVSHCISLLSEYGADNAGGRLGIRATNDSTLSNGIVYVLSNPFGVGKSRFRIAALNSGVLKNMETVFGGCYRRALFDEIGMLDERLLRTADKAFNRKLIRNKGSIVMDTSLTVMYFPRTQLSQFVRDAFRSGYWAGAPLAIIQYPTIARRQLMPAAFVLSIVGLCALSFVSIGFFLLLCLVLVVYGIGAERASRNYSGKGCSYKYIILPPLFLTLHIFFGLGFLSSLTQVLSSGPGRANLIGLIRRIPDRDDG